MPEHILNSHTLYGNGTVFRRHRTYRFSQSADNAVFLHRHNFTAFPRRLQNQFLIQRLDTAHIDHTGGNAVFCQNPCGFHRFRHQNTIGNQRNVGTVTECFTLANLKMIGIVMENRRCKTAETQIDR